MATAGQLRDAAVYRIQKALAGNDWTPSAGVFELGGELGLLIQGAHATHPTEADIERRGRIKGLILAAQLLDEAMDDVKD